MDPRASDVSLSLSFEVIGDFLVPLMPHDPSRFFRVGRATGRHFTTRLSRWMITRDAPGPAVEFHSVSPGGVLRHHLADRRLGIGSLARNVCGHRRADHVVLRRPPREPGGVGQLGRNRACITYSVFGTPTGVQDMRGNCSTVSAIRHQVMHASSTEPRRWYHGSRSPTWAACSGTDRSLHSVDADAARATWPLPPRWYWYCDWWYLFRVSRRDPLAHCLLLV